MNWKFWRHGRQDRDLDEELQSHLRMATQDRIESGKSQVDAETEARREMGNQGLIKEATREVWGFAGIERLRQDLRYGMRVLWKNPVYALVSILTLALGIGASTAIFSVVYGVLLRSLPYHKPEQIVRMYEVGHKGNQMAFADPNFADMHGQARSLQGMAQMYWAEDTVSVGSQAERTGVAYVSRDFFEVMGVSPVTGRLFVPEEQHVGATQAALVSYSFWQQQLHEVRDLSAVKFSVANKPAFIVGVLPPGFHFPEATQVWLPHELFQQISSRTAHNSKVVARLRYGVSLDEARAEASTIAKRIQQQIGPAEDYGMVDAAVVPLRDALTTDVKPALLVLLAVAGLLLLVACANVMNLSLAQASARAGELAIRSALGASRWRLVRQFLAEALLLCTIGGFLGVLAAHFGVRVLLAMAPSNIPRLDEISVNLPVLLFALGLSVFLAGGLGVFTALRATSVEARTGLAEGGRGQGSGARSQRTGRMIVAGQVAITLTLLVGAGLLGRSMLRVLSIYPGFRTEHVATLNLRLPGVRDGEGPQRARFLAQLISRLRSLPGIQSVGGATGLPLKEPGNDGAFVLVNPQQLSSAQRDLIERSTRQSWQNADPGSTNDMVNFFQELFRNPANTGYADYIVADEGYFQSLGIPLLRGRLFNEADGPDRPHVAVISESVARQKWPDSDPLGQTIEFGNMDGDLRLLAIVGVVGDIRMRTLEKEPRPTIYVNYRQRPRATEDFSVVVRTGSDPQAVFAAARRILNELDPTVPPRFETFDQILSASLNNRRFNLLLIGVFAGAALLLAMAGIFGVLAYSVARRTREIGVRIALGATPNNVLGLVFKQALKTTMVGVAVGLLSSFILTRFMQSLLFQVSPNDPVTLAGVALLLVTVAILAAYLPARRATKVDPIVALRYE